MRVTLIASIMLAGLCAGLSAAPAAPASPPAAPAAAVQDARLSKQITLSETRVTLEDLLKKVSQQTGVTMEPDFARRTWKTRELPVSVQLKNVTAADFQRQIAKLLDLHWTRTGAAGSFTYVLWQDENARDRERAALTAKEDARIQKLTDGWQRAGQEFAQAAASGQSPGGKQDAFSQFASTDPFGSAYSQLLAGLAPAVIPSLGAEDSVHIPAGMLPPAAQQNVQQFAAQVTGLESKMGGRAGQDLSSVNWSQTTITVRSMPGGSDHAGLSNIGFLGSIRISGGGLQHNIGFPIIDPGSQLGGMFADAITRINKGEDPHSVEQDVGQKLKGLVEASQEQSAADAQAKVTDPRLLKTVEIKPGDANDVAAALAPVVDATGLAIYAEGWKRPGATAQADKGTVQQVLDRICRRFGMTWTLDGDAIRIKASDWAERRAAMVPQADIQYWIARVKDKGSLDLDDLEALATTYTPEQIGTLMAADKGIAGSAWPLASPSQRKAILFYGSLDSGQAKMARSDEGISALGLSESQRQALLPVLTSQGIVPQMFFAPGSAVRISEDGGNVRLVLAYGPDKTSEVVLARAVPKKTDNPKPAQQSATKDGTSGQ